jgi:hypothetical protein
MPEWLVPNFMQLPVFLAENLAWIALGLVILGVVSVVAWAVSAVRRRR